MKKSNLEKKIYAIFFTLFLIFIIIQILRVYGVIVIKPYL